MKDGRVEMPRADIARELRHEAEAEAEMGRLAAKPKEGPGLEGDPGGGSSEQRRRGIRGWLARLAGRRA